LKEAKDLIEGTFGFTITGTVKDTKHWYKKDTFFLVNHLPHDWLLKCAQAAPEAEMARRGLLMVVMALIYCEVRLPGIFGAYHCSTSDPFHTVQEDDPGR
jgi:hypothetical protein